MHMKKISRILIEGSFGQEHNLGIFFSWPPICQSNSNAPLSF